jgi:hypothetical protein
VRAQHHDSHPGNRLPDEARRKLAIIAARLGSDYEGERAAAALLATRLLEGFGLRWDDVLAVPALPQPPVEKETRGRREQPPRNRWSEWVEPVDWTEAMDRCAECLSLFSDWEKDFILRMRAMPSSAWTPKRVNVAERLTAKARAWFASGGAS